MFPLLPTVAGKYFSDYYGFGIINVARAVEVAQNWEKVGPEIAEVFTIKDNSQFTNSICEYPFLIILSVD